MNKGFITSALLYGILSLFLVLVLSTIAIIGNRRLAIDKIKQSALDDVQELTTPEKCFVVSEPSAEKKCSIMGYTYDTEKKCSANVFIPKTVGLGANECEIVSIEEGSFGNQTNVITVTVPENIEIKDAFNGCNNLTVIIKGNIDPNIEGNHEYLWGATNIFVKQG